MQPEDCSKIKEKWINHPGLRLYGETGFA